jgi:hypothetical protein
LEELPGTQKENPFFLISVYYYFFYKNGAWETRSGKNPIKKGGICKWDSPPPEILFAQKNLQAQFMVAFYKPIVYKSTITATQVRPRMGAEGVNHGTTFV